MTIYKEGSGFLDFPFSHRLKSDKPFTASAQLRGELHSYPHAKVTILNDKQARIELGAPNPPLTVDLSDPNSDPEHYRDIQYTQKTLLGEIQFLLTYKP